jgi:hypothetical protein
MNDREFERDRCRALPLRAQVIPPVLHIGGRDLNQVLRLCKAEEVSPRPTIDAARCFRNRLIDEGSSRPRVKLPCGDFPITKNFWL